MWGHILQVNSVLWALSGVFLIYATGAAIFSWSWKQFLLALLLFVFFSVTEIVFAALQEP